MKILYYQKYRRVKSLFLAKKNKYILVGTKIKTIITTALHDYYRFTNYSCRSKTFITHFFFFALNFQFNSRKIFFLRSLPIRTTHIFCDNRHNYRVEFIQPSSGQIYKRQYRLYLNENRINTRINQ